MKISIFHKKISLKNIDSLLFGVGIFILSQPFYVWHLDYFRLFVLMLLLLISVGHLKRIKEIDLLIVTLFLYFFLYLSLELKIHGAFFRTSPILFLLIREDKMLDYLKWFKNIFVFALLLSLIVYFLIVFFNIPVGYNKIPPLNQLKQFDYVQYPFLVSNSILGFSHFNIRFSGMFDEPGVVGTIVVILLFADNYNLKNRSNIVLLIAGILSFSIFFIISSLVYFIYISKIGTKLIIIMSIVITFLTTYDNTLIYSLVWDRLTIEDGQLKGDNRSHESLELSYENFLKSDDIIFGKGANFAEDNDLLSSASYKLLLINYGFLLLIIAALAFFTLAYYNIKNKNYLFGYLFLIGGIFYQRPGETYAPATYFLLIATVFAFKNLAINHTLNQTT